MKFNKLLIIAALVIAVSCDSEDERLDFLSSADNVVAQYYGWEDTDTVSVVEGTTGSIRLEAPIAFTTDPTTVVIEMSGSAVTEVGTEITIENGTSLNTGEVIQDLTVSGTTITGTINNADTLTSLPLDIDITVATDGVTDGDKVLVFTLVSATRNGAALGVGVNGDLIAKPVKIADADCPSDLNGTYDSGNSCFATDSSTPTWTEQAQNGVYDVTDFTGGWYAFAGAPQIAAVVKEACGALSIDGPYDPFAGGGSAGLLSFINMTGSVDETTGVMTLTWTEENGFGNGGAPVTCTTTWTPQ